FHELMVQEFFAGRFGSLEIGFSAAVYALVQLVVLLMVAGLVAALVANQRAVARVWDVVLLLAVIAASQLLLLHVVSYRSLAGGTGDPLIVVRYLIPLCVVYGLAGRFVSLSAG